MRRRSRRGRLACSTATSFSPSVTGKAGQTQGLVPAEGCSSHPQDSDLQGEAAPSPARPSPRTCRAASASPGWAACPAQEFTGAPGLGGAATQPGSQVFPRQPEPCPRQRLQDQKGHRGPDPQEPPGPTATSRPTSEAWSPHGCTGTRRPWTRAAGRGE